MFLLRVCSKKDTKYTEETQQEVLSPALEPRLDPFYKRKLQGELKKGILFTFTSTYFVCGCLWRPGELTLFGSCEIRSFTC